MLSAVNGDEREERTLWRRSLSKEVQELKILSIPFHARLVIETNRSVCLVPKLTHQCPKSGRKGERAVLEVVNDDKWHSDQVADASQGNQWDEIDEGNYPSGPQLHSCAADPLIEWRVASFME